MTQPVTLPSATTQRQAAAEVFAQYEPPLYEAYLEMMLEWLAAVKVAMFTGGVARLGLVPDPLKVFSQTPKWHSLTEQYTAKVAENVLAAPYRDLFTDGTLFESRPFVRNWIADRTNRLQRVPDGVYGHVATIIDKATVNGASIADVQDQIGKLFDATDVQQWKNRARTVARTEVVGAYNGGLHDAFSMVAENDPGTAYVHRWLATEDQRTRPDHREADGQVQPWGQPFLVGGFAMMHPHDPDGPPQEVINCVPAETLVWFPSVRSAFRRWYEGEMVAVRLATGDELTITPNHPVLRADGRWTPAGLLQKGDHLVRAFGRREAAGKPDQDSGPSQIGQIYDAARLMTTPERVVLAPPDLHGDGADGEVEIVPIHGSLAFHGEPASDEQVRRFGLSLANAARSADGTGLSHGVAVRSASGEVDLGSSLGSVGGGDHRTALLDAHPGRPDEVCLAAVTDFQAHLVQAPKDDLTADVAFSGHRQDADALVVGTAEVVQVDRYSFEGHVFNLDTGHGWYTAQSIVTGNCRCTELMEIKNEPTRMDNRQYKDGLTLAAAAFGFNPLARLVAEPSCGFCLETHKPGLCKGQHRGGAEPGQRDANKGNPAVKAQIAVKGLNTAIAQAQAVADTNAVTNPKLAAMARKAVGDYRKALRPHQQALKDAARANRQAQQQGQRDTREQDAMDRRAQRQKESLKARAKAILDRRAEKAKLAKMSPKQRTAYHKAKAAAAAKQRTAQENKIIKDAGK